jgi:alpha-beta hydrolase superfamily lysophospholipase
MEQISFTTSDHVEIMADYYASAGKRFALLLHMMPATKESWRPFAEKLVANGFDVLAIDERGHGESTMGGSIDYRNFTEAQQQAKMLDVEAAMDWLKSKGATDETTVIVGASIGANLAIQYLGAHPHVAKVVALSPGKNYRGVAIEPAIQRLTLSGHLLLVASEDDDRLSYADVMDLHHQYPKVVEVILEKNLGHGTTMFEKKPSLMDQVIQWLR